MRRRSVLMGSVVVAVCLGCTAAPGAADEVRDVGGPFVSLFAGWGSHGGGVPDGFGVGGEAGWRVGNLRPSLTIHSQGSKSEFAALALAANLQVDFSPDLWANRPPAWRVTPFVGIGAGVLWELLAFEPTADRVDVVKVRRSVGEAEVHGFGQLAVGVSFPLVKRREMVVEVCPQLRYVFGALDTDSLVVETALRWWF